MRALLLALAVLLAGCGTAKVDALTAQEDHLKVKGYTEAEIAEARAEAAKTDSLFRADPDAFIAARDSVRAARLAPSGEIFLSPVEYERLKRAEAKAAQAATFAGITVSIQLIGIALWILLVAAGD